MVNSLPCRWIKYATDATATTNPDPTSITDTAARTQHPYAIWDGASVNANPVPVNSILTAGPTWLAQKTAIPNRVAIIPTRRSSDDSAYDLDVVIVPKDGSGIVSGADVSYIVNVWNYVMGNDDSAVPPMWVQTITDNTITATAPSGARMFTLSGVGSTLLYLEVDTLGAAVTKLDIFVDGNKCQLV